MTPTRYYQRLSHLADAETALVVDPVVFHRLARIRAANHHRSSSVCFNLRCLRGIHITAVIGASLLLAACGSSDESAPVTVTASPSTVTVSQSASVAAPAPVEPPVATATPAPAAAAGPWVMPNVVGQDLQAAQNTIQALTDYKVFFSGSKDLSGQSRMQINDRNWQVCTSTPPAGATFTEQTAVEFGVVKESEACP